MRSACLLIFACNLFAQGKPLPLFRALVTSGWNEKPTTEFVVEADRKFVWRSGNTVREGSFDTAALAGLIAHIQAATPGPAANDVGMLQATWRGKTGKPVSKTFYFPGRAPAASLVQEIDALSARYSKALNSEEKK